MAGKAVYEKLWIALLVGLLASCSSAQTRRIPGNPDPLIKGEVTEEKVQRALEMKLAKQIEFLEQNSERFKKQVVSLPSGDAKYHFKHYDEFPEGPAGVDIAIVPLETFSPSHKADVKYRKIRYQTRYTKSASRAAEDSDFIRDEGVQNEIYEFDGAKWELKSSIFEVRKTSVYSEDRWQASRGRIRRVEEEEPELFVDKVRNLFGLFD